MVEKEDKQDPWMTNSFPAHERPEMPELTIGLAVYNGSAGLTAALDSLLAHLYAVHRTEALKKSFPRISAFRCLTGSLSRLC
jgi:hypothetical protein